MKTKTLSGSYFEIGKQLGRMYKKNGFSDKKLKLPKESIIKKQLTIYKKYYPEYLEELRGIADGGKFDYTKIRDWFITSGLDDKIKGCTIFGIKNKDGYFIGRNYDWINVCDKHATSFKVKHKQAYSYLAGSDMWIPLEGKINPAYLFFSVDDGINKKGLFIGLTYAHHKDRNYGLGADTVIKLVLEKCKNVNEALKLFKKLKICYPKNFFLADKKGNMAIFSTTSKKYRIIYPDKDGILIQTNHFIHQDLVKEDTRPKIPMKNSKMRYNKVKFMLKNNKTSLKLMKNILSNHKGQVCGHHKTWKTNWSWIIDYKKSSYYLCSGSPCKNKFTKIKVNK